MSKLLYCISKENHVADKIEKILKKNTNIKFVSLMGVDLGGNSTDEKIPVSLLLDDIDGFLNSPIQTDGSSVELYNIATLNNAKVDLLPDLCANWYVDYNHEFIDPESELPVGTLKIPAFLIHDNKMVCSRGILLNAENNFKSNLMNIIEKNEKIRTGLGIDSVEEINSISLTSATELEFWVNTPEDKADLDRLYVSQSLKEQYWKRTHGVIRTCLEQCLLLLEDFGMYPEMAHKEVGGVRSSINTDGMTNHAMEQLEISWKYSTPLQAADNEILVREIVEDVFTRNGLEVSFKAKPIKGVAGSGAHTHVGASLILKNGKMINLFAPKDMKSDFLSEIGYGAVMGLLKNYEVLGSIVTNTSDGYNRLVPGFEAPVCTVTSLGHTYDVPSRNRSVLVGLIRDIDNPKTLRFELRSPNPLSNKYLVMAGCYQCVLDGITKVVESGYDTKALEKELSKNPGEEAMYLEKDRAYRDEKNIFNCYDEEERIKRFGKAPATVYEAMKNLDKYSEKLAVLKNGDVFSDAIIDSFKTGSIEKWKKKLATRTIDRNIKMLVGVKKIHNHENMDALDEVNWNSIEELKLELMKDTLKRPSIFGQIKNAIKIGDYEEASKLQLIYKKKVDELQIKYKNYIKNIY